LKVVGLLLAAVCAVWLAGRVSELPDLLLAEAEGLRLDCDSTLMCLPGYSATSIMLLASSTVLGCFFMCASTYCFVRKGEGDLD
jgi:hypothetical protein